MAARMIVDPVFAKVGAARLRQIEGVLLGGKA